MSISRQFIHIVDEYIYMEFIYIAGEYLYISPVHAYRE